MRQPINGIVKTVNDKIWIPEIKREKFILEYHRKLCHAGLKKSKNILK